MSPDEVVIEALQAALAGEHASVWGYGVAGARLPEPTQEQARTLLDTHRASVVRLTALVDQRGAVPVAAEVAYALPFPVEDAASARRLATLVERRLAAVYADLVAASDSRQLRTAGASGLRDAAVRAARWSGRTGPFPGLPDLRA